MRQPPRPLPFVLAATEQGTLIVNRLDYRMVDSQRGFGVGFQLLNGAAFDPGEVEMAGQLLDLLRESRGSGVVALDCGANIGVHALSWARQMTGWGEVLAIEAQERIFYALAGNICLNNCFNARALHAAVGDAVGTLRIPQPDYRRPASFGSLELRQRSGTEDIGQPVSYADAALRPVPQVTIDSLALARVDFIKIDVEGMEAAVLAGARGTLARCRPLLLVEHIKSGQAALREVLEGSGYRCMLLGMNILAVPADDPLAARIRIGQPPRA